MKKVRIICIRSPRCLGIFLGTALLGAVAFCSGPYLSQAIPVLGQSRQLPIYSVDQGEKLVSISFDAAWGNEDTQELIDILDEYQVTATFFIVGEWVDKYPESVKALFEAGHEVMNHSNDHAHYPKLSPQEIIDDLNACNDKIQAITGVRPTLVRLPYGDYDDQVISTIRSLGMEPIQWDVDSLDWKDHSAQEISTRVLDRVGEGSIVLFHNAALHTPEALPTILSSLQDQGFTFLPISQLLLEGDYAIDHTGRQYALE